MRIASRCQDGPVRRQKVNTFCIRTVINNMLTHLRAILGAKSCPIYIVMNIIQAQLFALREIENHNLIRLSMKFNSARFFQFVFVLLTVNINRSVIREGHKVKNFTSGSCQRYNGSRTMLHHLCGNIRSMLNDRIHYNIADRSCRHFHSIPVRVFSIALKLINVRRIDKDRHNAIFVIINRHDVFYMRCHCRTRSLYTILIRA